MKFTPLVLALAAALPTLAMADPQYAITDLGVVIPGSYTQAFGISGNGNYIVGRNLTDNNNVGPYPAFVWTSGSGMVGQPGAAGGHDFSWALGVNNSGVAVGYSGVNYTGTGAVPMKWSSGVATQLPMAGQNVGHVTDINNSGIAVGSVGGGVSEVAAIYNTNTNTTTMITALSASGSYMQTAYGINNAGLIVGMGVNNSRPVAVMYNSVTNVMTDVPLPAYSGSFNGSLAYDINENGVVVGSSGNSSQAFLWSAATGAINVALPSISSSGSLNAVNAQGWAVGSSGGVFSNPFLYADGATYLLSGLISNGAGWNFSTTTSAAAADISNTGVIVGTAEFNGIAHAYMLTPVPEPTSYALMAAGMVAIGFAARRRKTLAA